MMLCERLSEKCYILGDMVWHRPGLLKSEELTEEFKSSGNVYRLEQLNTVSDILECAKKMEGNNHEIIWNDKIEIRSTFMVFFRMEYDSHIQTLPWERLRNQMNTCTPRLANCTCSCTNYTFLQISFEFFKRVWITLLCTSYMRPNKF